MLNLTRMETWPSLAWVAELHIGSTDVSLFCGDKVECRDEWFCEAVWDGDFSEGNFHSTDVIFGSGGRVDDRNILFVSSGSTVDRLQWVKRADRIFVSNSLVALAVIAELKFDPSCDRFLNVFLSIVKGIDKYERHLPCEEGDVNLCYFHNLKWDGRCLSEVAKPNGSRRFTSYNQYTQFLKNSVEAIVRNGADSERCLNFESLGTLSTGYDSTCVSVLGKASGLDTVICFKRPGGRDYGGDIADSLDLIRLDADIDRWRDLDTPEPEFLSVDGVGAEVLFTSLEEELRGKLLLTGYHGDKIWDFDAEHSSPDLVRGDLSGLSLAEFRLRAGFLHCAIPFLGARSVADIIQISKSDEMSAWNTGQGYSRPIPRRIAEEAGVPRKAFGNAKSFASRWFLSRPRFLTSDSSVDFGNWLQECSQEGGQSRPSLPVLNQRVEKIQLELALWLVDIIGKIPGAHRMNLKKRWPVKWFANLSFENTHEAPWLPRSRLLVFPWAINRTAKKSYAVAPADEGKR